MQIMKSNFCHNTKYEPLAKVLASENCVAYMVFQHAVYVLCTVKPLYNGQVGAEAFVRYSKVSFIGRFYHNHVYLTPYNV